MRPLVQEIVIDCADPAGLAQFWGTVLESRWTLVDASWGVVEAQPVQLAFQQVPEPKTSPKNRLHLDIQVDDAATAVDRALSLGATTLDTSSVGDSGDGYVVLADPEGNEFCFVVDNSGDWAGVTRAALDAGPPPRG